MVTCPAAKKKKKKKREEALFLVDSLRTERKRAQKKIILRWGEKTLSGQSFGEKKKKAGARRGSKGSIRTSRPEKRGRRSSGKASPCKKKRCLPSTTRKEKKEKRVHRLRLTRKNLVFSLGRVAPFLRFRRQKEDLLLSLEKKKREPPFLARRSIEGKKKERGDERGRASAGRSEPSDDVVSRREKADILCRRRTA